MYIGRSFTYFCSINTETSVSPIIFASSIVLSFPNDILIVPFAYESGTFIALITRET